MFRTLRLMVNLNFPPFPLRRDRGPPPPPLAATPLPLLGKAGTSLQAAELAIRTCYSFFKRTNSFLDISDFHKTENTSQICIEHFCGFI